jgi:hypothetical protein
VKSTESSRVIGVFRVLYYEEGKKDDHKKKGGRDKKEKRDNYSIRRIRP